MQNTGAVSHHSGYKGEADWRMVGTYAGEGSVTKGEAGVKCCVQLRDRLREKVEESGRGAG